MNRRQFLMAALALVGSAGVPIALAEQIPPLRQTGRSKNPLFHGELGRYDSIRIIEHTPQVIVASTPEGGSAYYERFRPRHKRR